MDIDSSESDDSGCANNSNVKRLHNDLVNCGWGALRLRDYQMEGVRWMMECHRQDHGCILGDEMGLGKTCQTIAMLTLMKAGKAMEAPFLVICPRSVLENWAQEFKRFSPKLPVLVYIGTLETRDTLCKKVRQSQRDKQLCFDVLLTTYELCIKDASFLRSFPWQVMVVDEAHRLKNSDSLLYRTLEEWDINMAVLLTGTPVQNNLKELYSLLSLVSAQAFPSTQLQPFLERYSGQDADMRGLHAKLKPYLLRRTKADVLRDLPERSEVILYHGLSPLQKKLYKAILTKDVGAFESGSSSSVGPQSLMNILMQLRKCVNHPYLFDGVEPEPFVLGPHLVEESGKLLLLDRLLEHLHTTGHKVLLFSQMTHMLDILQDYLGYRDYSYERLDGSVRGEERFLAVQNFNKNEETFAFLLSTRAGGQGLNLTAADTVIFVDSDFNPQNDLQAAARAHRIGQTRPVKVIRLVGGHTVEEIVLKRAQEKLKLTEKVIEGGQFASAASRLALVAENRTQLQDILKFGVDELLNGEGDTEAEVDFAKMLGTSKNGLWQVESAPEEPEVSDEEPLAVEETPESMYMFEGKDYSKEPSRADRKAFNELISEQRALLASELQEERGPRRRGTVLTSLPELPCKPRKQLSAEELEERKKKRQEAAARRAKQAEEMEIRRAQEQKKKREELWKANDYTSCNLAAESSDEDEDEDSQAFLRSDDDDEESDEDARGKSRSIHYVSGDVTRPVDAGTADNIIVHCADDSGRWGRGGLFTAITARSLLPQEQYELAGQVKDIALGDCHLIRVDDVDPREEGQDYLALIIAQHRDKRNVLSGIKLPALRTGLQKIFRVAQEKKGKGEKMVAAIEAMNKGSVAASVHLPRIGHDTPGFNWYGTERLIKKHLASKGVPTYIYYFPRKHLLKRKQTAATAPVASSSKRQSASLGEEEEAKSESGARVSTSSKTSTSSSAATPVSLVDIFHGVSAYFHHLPEDSLRRLRRYFVAYDGDVHSSVQSSTTHVIVSSADSGKGVAGELGLNAKVKLVTEQWLADCLAQRKLLETEKYQV